MGKTREGRKFVVEVIINEVLENNIVTFVLIKRDTSVVFRPRLETQIDKSADYVKEYIHDEGI
jgi:hypothetical protein